MPMASKPIVAARPQKLGGSKSAPRLDVSQSSGRFSLTPPKLISIKANRDARDLLRAGGRQGYLMRATGLGRRSIGRGFTLIEVMLAMVIVGIGMTASMQLFLSTTQQNQSAVGMTVAINLAKNIQELMATAYYATDSTGALDSTGRLHWGLETGDTLDANQSPKALDIDDFDGKEFSPPISATWLTLDKANSQCDLTKYTQLVHVYSVSVTDLKTKLQTTADEGVRQVVVEIYYKPNAASAKGLVYTMSFLRFNDARY